jgi:excisionase family DNA binding protein
MSYTLAEAVALVGHDRSTLLRAIKSGKLSASRDKVGGAWRVDAAELARVYGPGIATGVNLNRVQFETRS